MPKSTYESLSGTVLDYKKAHKIGRFDPDASEKEAAKVKAMWTEVEEKRELSTKSPFSLYLPRLLGIPSLS